MKKTFVKGLALGFVGSLVMAGSAMAVPFTFGDGGAALQQVLDDITTAPVAGDSSVDVTMDAISDTYDSYWGITGSGGSISTMIIELAGFAGVNTFGIYDPTDPNNTVELFNGAATTGSQVALSVLTDGSIKINFVDTGVDFGSTNFGYYLDSLSGGDWDGTLANPVDWDGDGNPNDGGFFYSDTSLNTDGVDHMAAYQGNDIDTVKIGGLAAGTWTNSEYVLAWEDLDATQCNPDYDYTDMVIMVESIEPIPEPATMLLFGTGLAGLATLRRRKAKK